MLPRVATAGYASVDAARASVPRRRWYDNDHLHTRSGYVPPAARHAGEDIAQLADRRHARALSSPRALVASHAAVATPDTITLNPEAITHNCNRLPCITKCVAFWGGHCRRPSEIASGIRPYVNRGKQQLEIDRLPR